MNCHAIYRACAKALLGTDNDLIGAIGVRNMLPEAYGNVRSEAGFGYHFYARLRKGCADCRFYFQFR